MDVRVLATGNPALAIRDGLEVRRLPCQPYLLNLQWKEIARHARDADLIQTFTYHALWPTWKASRQLGIPALNMVLAQFGNAWHDMKPPLLGHLYTYLERKLLNLPFEATVYLSEFSRDFSRHISPSLRNKYVIEPGIDHENYYAAENKEYVFFCAKLDARKGLDTVLYCARQLPDIPFKIMGWGNLDRFGSFGLPANVELVPYKSRKELADWLAHARIFLFPTRIETFGLAVVEAMASGCSIVSSSELEFVGYRVPHGDNQGFLRGIRELWDDPERCVRMGAENRRLASMYTWDRHGEKMAELYHGVLQQLQEPDR